MLAGVAFGQAIPAEYDAALKSLGKRGDFKDNVLKVNIPRNDLKVTIDGIATPTPFGRLGQAGKTRNRPDRQGVATADAQCEHRSVAMLAWRALTRSIAVIFLLMTAAEVFGCELLSSPSCELSNLAGDSGRNGNLSGDDCLCCCHHVVSGPPPIALAPLESVEVVSPTVTDSILEVFSPAIEQPPRS